VSLREAVHVVRRMSLAEAATLARETEDPMLATVAGWRRQQPIKWHALLDAIDFPETPTVIVVPPAVVAVLRGHRSAA
jgi:hypothetical protein